MNVINSYITLNNLEIYAYHGVSPQETKVGNTYIINLKLKVDYSKAGETDSVEDTVSYADVFSIVKEVMSTPSKLLEHVVYRICEALFERFKQVEEIEIHLDKNNPPMGADIETAGVYLACRR